MSKILQPELRDKCIGMWLRGFPRDEIARELGISEGSVANIVDYYSQNDSTLELQRKMALVAAKDGIDIFQWASCTRFENAIKKRGANSEAIADFLSALQKQIELSEITQEQAIKSIIDCSEFSAKEKVPLTKLHQYIQDKYAELRRIQSEITKYNGILEASKIKTINAVQEDGLTVEAVRDFRRIRVKMNGVGLSLDDASETFNVILNLKQIGYDYPKVINKFSQISSAEDRLKKLEEEFCILEKNVAQFRNYEAKLASDWGNYKKGMQDYGIAMQMGLKLDHISAACAIFARHIHDFTLEQILNDIDIYGNLHRAIFVTNRAFEEISMKTKDKIDASFE